MEYSKGCAMNDKRKKENGRNEDEEDRYVVGSRASPGMYVPA